MAFKRDDRWGVARTRAARGLAAAVLAAACGAGCGRAETEPVKVERKDPSTRSERGSPFEDPKRDPPGERKPAQLVGEELEANIAKARALLAEGDSIRAMQLLYKCANKTPPSVRCDGELGMVLLENRSRKAHAEYFVAEAVRFDEPEADDDFYRRLAEVARSRGRFAVALAAIERVIERGNATAQDHMTRSWVLQSDRERIGEAIAELETAWEMKPENPEWLLERASLVAQTSDLQAAIDLFEQYGSLVEDDAKQSAMVAERLTTLRAQLAAQDE
jgi:tetratricopeptide (TPR) repeat protein